jgi:hypothetical protein
MLGLVCPHVLAQSLTLAHSGSTKASNFSSGSAVRISARVIRGLSETPRFSAAPFDSPTVLRCASIASASGETAFFETPRSSNRATISFKGRAASARHAIYFRVGAYHVLSVRVAQSKTHTERPQDNVKRAPSARVGSPVPHAAKADRLSWRSMQTLPK